MSFGAFDYFKQRFIENIKYDYFDVILVSSRGRGRVPSSGRPYRVGKSTFALWLSYFAHKQYYDYKGINKTRDEVWDDVFEHLFYSIYDLKDYIKKLSHEGREIPAIVWDEAELTAPAYQKIPNKLRRALNEINTYGTQVKFIILTAPSLNYLSKPLRMMITFECLIPKRGYYEIQYIEYRKDFDNVMGEKTRYIYVGEGTFPPLPPEIDKRYQEWRSKIPAMLGEQGKQESDEEEEENRLDPKIIRALVEYYKVTRPFIVYGEDGKVYLKINGSKHVAPISSYTLKQVDKFIKKQLGDNLLYKRIHYRKHTKIIKELEGLASP